MIVVTNQTHRSALLWLLIQSRLMAQEGDCVLN
jgi:hypothetical protein